MGINIFFMEWNEGLTSVYILCSLLLDLDPSRRKQHTCFPLLSCVLRNSSLGTTQDSLSAQILWGSGRCFDSDHHKCTCLQDREREFMHWSPILCWLHRTGVQEESAATVKREPFHEAYFFLTPCIWIPFLPLHVRAQLLLHSVPVLGLLSLKIEVGRLDSEFIESQIPSSLEQ